MIQKSLTLIFAVFLFFINSCSNKNEDVLAQIGDTEIQIDEFVNRLKEVRQSSNLPDNGQIRNTVFNELLNENLFISEAKRIGLDKDSIAVKEIEKIKIKKSLDSFIDQNVFSNFNISDDELKKYFVLSSSKVKARHLYAPSYEEADSLYELLKNGDTFDNLAQTVFKDPALSKTGGDLGYFSYDDMDYAFAEKAFSMKEGEISKPVKTKYGYSIIKVEDRIGNPFPTEIEFLKQKNKLYKEYKARKKDILAMNYVDSLSESLNISFNQEGLALVFSLVGRSGLQNQDLEQNNWKIFDPSNGNKLLLRFEQTEWTINEFLEKAQFTSERQRKSIKTRENLKDFISGIIVRQLLIKKAEKQGLTTTSEFNEAFKKEFDLFLIKRIKDKIRSEMSFTDAEMKSFYNDNEYLFRESSKVNVSEIIVDNENIAIDIYKKLNDGRKFDDLAKKYSINKYTAVQGGEVGYVTAEDLGPFSSEIFSLNKNEWKGPFKKGSYYFFLKSNGKIDGNLVDFEKAKPAIKEKLVADNYTSAINNELKKIRKNIKVTAYPEKLRNIRYN
ncbi:MAG: peptidylprolyl isomerase [Calditrichae bacterium]|nr:peptidylprolyl isomerase [Calditrichia bacterium]